MQSGGPIAFYEIAATLIPAAFLGGFLADRYVTAEEKGPRKVLHLAVTDFLPFVVLYAIVAELIALDVVVTRSTDSPKGAIVAGTLIIGFIATALPSVQHGAEQLLPRHEGPMGLWLAASLGTVLVLAAGLFGTILMKDLLSTEAPYVSVPASPSPPVRSERVWLRHLIATSDYRIDKLQAEKETARSEAAKKRIERHLDHQKAVHEGQQKYLHNVLSN